METRVARRAWSMAVGWPSDRERRRCSGCVHLPGGQGATALVRSLAPGDGRPRTRGPGCPSAGTRADSITPAVGMAASVCLPTMLIEATPRDRESLIALLPQCEGEALPIPFGELTGREIPSPEGVTVQFTGAELYRSVGVAPLLTFAVTVAGGSRALSSLGGSWSLSWSCRAGDNQPPSHRPRR